MDVGGWLKGLGLEQYEATFRENGVSKEDLCHLTAGDLQHPGVVFVGRRLLVVIVALRLKSMPADDAVLSSPGPPINPGTQPDTSETAAERRSLGVMSCDLIGSTVLSARLDLENLREVIRSYQARVATAMRQFHGFIVRHVGDGVLIDFGWPEAYETDAERAGLAVATASRCKENMQR